MGALSSPRRLITDLTLPVLSLFSGKSVDAILKTALGEHGDIEDLWLAFFCCSTNLTRGELSTHVRGTTWKCVRASMTVLGLLPPVVSEDGDFLVDGGYLNSIPVDVMREKMGVETVIVVDVDDDDYLAFRNLTPHDGGLGGWRLLWERVNPFTAEWLSRSWLWRPWSATPDRGPLAPTATRARPPSYASLLNALMRATSNRALASASKDHEINLYLRPPGVASGWIAPMHAARVDALVRRAHRHASGAIADWQRAAREESTVRARSAAAEAARREARAERGTASIGRGRGGLRDVCGWRGRRGDAAARDGGGGNGVGNGDDDGGGGEARRREETERSLRGTREEAERDAAVRADGRVRRAAAARDVGADELEPPVVAVRDDDDDDDAAADDDDERGEEGDDRGVREAKRVDGELRHRLRRRRQIDERVVVRVRRRRGGGR